MKEIKQRWKYLHGGKPVMISPDMASHLLESNQENRPCSPNKVAEHVQRLQGGHWEVTPDPIMFTGPSLKEPDRLLNGQHRLTAIVKTGITAPLIIVGEADEAVMSAIDTGKSRSAADVLALGGNKYSVELASAVRILLPLCRRSCNFSGSGGGRGTVTASDVERQVGYFPDLEASILKVKNLKFKGLDVSIGAALHWAFAKDDEITADDFFESLHKVDGIDGTAAPAAALRHKLENTGPMGPLGRTPKVAWFMQAWQAFSCGTTMRTSRGKVVWWEVGDAFPWDALPSSVFKIAEDE